MPGLWASSRLEGQRGGPSGPYEVWSATADKTVAIAEASEGLSGSLRCARAIASATLWLGLCVALRGSCALYWALGLSLCAPCGP